MLLKLNTNQFTCIISLCICIIVTEFVVNNVYKYVSNKCTSHSYPCYILPLMIVIRIELKLFLPNQKEILKFIMI